MQLQTYNNPRSNISEAYRLIRTNIEYSNIDKELKTILITSSQPNEGKSTVISNLAATFANLENKKVLIIDCDLRNPSVHKMFHISNLVGITDILTGQKKIEECIEKTKIENLHLLKVGKRPPNPSEMLQSKKMREFIELIRDYYDYIFIDSPPVGVVADASVLAQYCDGTILLVSANEVDIEATKISKERLERVNANILGAVLNKFDASEAGYGYYSYYYYGEKENSNKKKSKFTLFNRK